MRELRRLQRGGEHQPGHAAARAYLECLSELPWARTSESLRAQRAQHAQRGEVPPPGPVRDIKLPPQVS